jgi:hypothetical protein
VKPLVFLIVFGFTTLTSHAQLRLGVKAGLNSYKYNGSGVDDAGLSRRSGLLAGGIVRVPLHNGFSLQPELLFSHEGAVWTEPGYKETEKLAFLNIPLLLNYHWRGLELETGPQIGILLSAKQTVIDGSQTTDEDISADFQGFGCSWAFGIGYRFNNGFGLGGRYNAGMNSLVDFDAVVRSSGFNVAVSYLFGSNR